MKATISLCFLLSVAFGADWDSNYQQNALPFSMQSRIFGGIVSNLGTFPYMVSLFIAKQNGDSFCGGSLITGEFVLTAAHCLSGATTAKVYLGARVISRESEPNREEILVGKEAMIVHENYDGPAYLHDIALLKLPKRVKFSDEIQPIRLARRSQNNLVQHVSVITGWGRTGNRADRSDVLRYAKRTILPDEVCQTLYQKYYHPSNICIDGSGQSPCPGDSGGPAVIVEQSDRSFTQVGVASYVHSSGCENGLPVSYTRITSYLDWIHKHTGITIKD